MVTSAKPRPPRVSFSTTTPAAGERVLVRTMVNHRMETGMRRRATGEPIPRNIINRFVCTFNGEPLFTWEPDTAVSPMPYLEFRFVARSSGELHMVWEDEAGERQEARQAITVA